MLANMPLASPVRIDGFVTQLIGLLGKSTAELEKILGYGAGRLQEGYTLLLLADTIGPNDFELRGMTTFPDGVPRGQPLNARLNTEAMVRGSLSQVAADRGRFDALKAQQAREIFVTSGPKRIAKVMPVRGGAEYPPGSGIPQWRIGPNKKNFIIGAHVGRGERVFRRPNDTLYVGTRLAPYV